MVLQAIYLSVHFQGSSGIKNPPKNMNTTMSMYNNITMQSNDNDDDSTSTEESKVNGDCKIPGANVKKHGHIDNIDRYEEQKRKKQRALTAAALSQHQYAVPTDSRPVRISELHSNLSTGSMSSATIGRNNTSITQIVATATMELQQQQLQDQIHELLIAQSTLRTSNSTTSSIQTQQRNNERMMVSNLASTSDRNNELQRLLLLSRSGQSSNDNQFDTDRQQLHRLLRLQREGVGAGIRIADMHSLSTRQLLSEQCKQQHQERLSDRNKELLIEELLLSQSRGSHNDSFMSHYATAAATTNDPVGSMRYPTTLLFPTGNDHDSKIRTSSSRAMTNGPVISGLVRGATGRMPASNPGGNPRAPSAAHLLSRRHNDVSSNQRAGQLKVGDNYPNHYSSSDDLQNLAMLRRQLQDRAPVSNLNRDTSLEEMLTVHNENIKAALDTAITISSSKIDQLQQLHRHQQMAAAQEAALRSAALQSLLVSNNLPSRNSLRTSDRATIPNTSITSLPMGCTSADEKHLSKYQVLIRRQLEYFVSQEDDVGYSVQGRKKQIIIGQVGIRCRHCSYMPHRLRGRGAGYYPSKLSGVYQAAQNMATNHLNQFCNSIPGTVRDELCSLRGGRHESIVGGGKQYWTNKCIEIGLTEYDDGVYFKGHVPACLSSS